jgi:transcriptional regulator with XRE-family HTH domain
MNVNMHLIQKWIKKRKEQKLYEMKPIGSAIRLKRKSMNMTLEEGAEGICSISYLSKIENNMIELSDQFVDRLMERFQMKPQPETDDQMYQNHLKTLIKCLIHGDLPAIEILSRYHNREDHQSFLLGFVIYHLHHKIELRDRCFDQLKIFIPNMSHHELALTLSVLGSYFISVEQYQDASKVVSMAPEESLISIELSMLLKRIKLIASMRMHRFIDVIDHMNPFMQQAMHLHYYKLMSEIKSEFYTFCALYADPIQMSEMIQAMSTLSPEEKAYIIALTQFGNGQYDEVLSIAAPHAGKSANWMILYLLALDHVSEIEALIDCIAHMPAQLELTEGLKRVRTHLYYKHHPDKLETLAYLRREILGFRTLPDDHLISEFLMIDSANLFSKYQHYKEATQVIGKFTLHLKSLKMAEFKLIPED